MFTIQSTGNAVTEHQMRKEIAGYDARMIMKTNMKVAEAKINSKDKTIGKYIDLADAKKEYEKNRRDYDRMAPESLTSEAKNAMWKKAKQLKDEFTVGMLSYDELHPVKGLQVDGTMKWVVDYEKIATNRTVERNTEWYNRNSSKLSEFKNIMRHLNPDNPMASDVEKFRPRKRSL